ncbi:MAG: hypothetical protein ACR2NR_04935 [Solirubrobacteraceae bacterium]
MNELTETLGVAPLELLDAAADVLLPAAELELELDELPQAVTATLAHSTSAATTGLLFSKCTVTSSSCVMQHRRVTAQGCTRLSDCRND